MSTPHCPVARCPHTVEQHLVAISVFAVEHERMPRQRSSAPNLLPDEAHLGQWIRSLFARQRHDTLRPDDPHSLRVVLAQRVATPPRHLHAPSGAQREKVSVHAMVAAIHAFVERHGRLPRLFGVEEPEEKLAGQHLNTLRTIARGSRTRDRRRLSAPQRAAIDRQLRGWEGELDGLPKRVVPRYRLAA